MTPDSLDPHLPEHPLSIWSIAHSGYSWRGGSDVPESARVICIAEDCHYADPSTIGAFVRQVANPNDIILLEGNDLGASAEAYQLNGVTNTELWDDISLNALSALIVGREVSVEREIALLNARSAVRKILDRMVNYCYGTTPKSERLQRAMQRLNLLERRVVLYARNEVLVQRVVECANQTTGRVIVIAGASHLGRPVQRSLKQLGLSHAILGPIHSPDVDVRAGELYLESIVTEGRQLQKQQWLTGQPVGADGQK